MIPIFDLDDTLYPERSFVESGFFSVALYLQHNFGWPIQESIDHMITTLERDGRGAVFDKLLQSHGIKTANFVRNCVNVYRYHQPKIQLYSAAVNALSSLSSRPYLVTDGHKSTQQNKIKALDLESKFEKIFITHRYGIRHAKPSIYCFDLIRKRVKCNWSDMFYVGDNPFKDFVNLNLLGVKTIRVTTGEHASRLAKPGFDAQHVISTLDELPDILKKITL